MNNRGDCKPNPSRGRSIFSVRLKFVVGGNIPPPPRGPSRSLTYGPGTDDLDRSSFTEIRAFGQERNLQRQSDYRGMIRRNSAGSRIVDPQLLKKNEVLHLDTKLFRIRRSRMLINEAPWQLTSRVVRKISAPKASTKHRRKLVLYAKLRGEHKGDKISVCISNSPSSNQLSKCLPWMYAPHTPAAGGTAPQRRTGRGKRGPCRSTAWSVREAYDSTSPHICYGYQGQKHLVNMR